MTRRVLVPLAFLLWAANAFAQSAGPAAEAAALERAIRETPQDGQLYVRLSQTYAVLDRPSAALEAIEHAVSLLPESAELLRARATLATWAGSYVTAQDSYRRLAKLQPDDDDISLNLARVSAWSGRTDDAVDAYKRYLRVKPGSAPAWIELARTEMWRGNYAAALENLETYQRRFGKDEKWTRETAAVLARAGRPREALDILEPMLRQQPDDYELNLTRTIALTMDHRAGAATDSLQTLRRLQPHSSDTRSVERTVRTALASAADPGASFYHDSSTLEIQRVEPRATVAFGNGTTASGGFEHENLWAGKGSGLERVGGIESAQHDQIWIGATHQLPGINISGRVGQARTSVDDVTTYALGAELVPHDGVKLSIDRTYGFFVVSPRTIGLGLRQTGTGVRADWSPTLRSAITGNLSYQALSDGNRRWEF